MLMHGVLCSTGWLHSGYLSTLLQTADGHHAGDRAHAERSHVSYSPPFLQQPSWFCCLHPSSSLPGSAVYTLLLPFLVLLSTPSFPSWFCGLNPPSSLPGSAVYTLLPFLVLLSTPSFFPPGSAVYFLLSFLVLLSTLSFFSKSFNKRTKRTYLFLEGWVRTGYTELSRGKATSNQRKT